MAIHKWDVVLRVQVTRCRGGGKRGGLTIVEGETKSWLPDREGGEKRIEEGFIHIVIESRLI